MISHPSNARRAMLSLWGTSQVIGGNSRSQSVARAVLTVLTSCAGTDSRSAGDFLRIRAHGRSIVPELVKLTSYSERRIQRALRALESAKVIKPRYWDHASIELNPPDSILEQLGAIK